MWSFINSALYCSHALDIVKTVLEDSVEYGGQNTNFKFKRPSFVDLKKKNFEWCEENRHVIKSSLAGIKTNSLFYQYFSKVTNYI